MKKLFLSIMLVAGVYGLAIGQQGSTSGQQGSTSGQQGSTSKSNDNWVKIGEKTVDLSQDHGIFNWDTDREKSINANDRYSAIKFRAKDAPVSLTNVEVVYDNGKKSDLSINSPVQVNNESKPVTLDSKERLDKITFNYSKNESAGQDKAKIELWGLKAGSTSGMGQSDQSGMGSQDKSGKNNDMSRSSTKDKSSTGKNAEPKRK